uniref:exodeoxyribonuclease V subunit alpha n=1 Tax=Halomonas sp. TaxID=1486246 RepID=UPI002603D9AA|nr:exodeoxyribonuclease V subunit alpha [Halomonas sp.]
MSQHHPALSDRGTLLALLDRWVTRGWLKELDRTFAEFLVQECPDASPLLLLAAALTSHQLGRGHLCLDLAETLNVPDLALSLPPEGDGLEDLPPLPSQVLAGLSPDEWAAALAHPELVGHGHGVTPLVAEHIGHATDITTRLYLRRYWQHEQDIRQSITARLDTAASNPDDFAAPLDALFPRATDIDWQRQACALAARSPFAVITGGPGTGKTTTVVKLLALLQSHALKQTGRALRIRLAAPTGKAAARLNASIAAQVENLMLDGLSEDPQRLRDAIPSEVVTLHRLLGSRPDTRRLQHNAQSPLALDMLVVDEASMVDVEMMAALLKALPHQARLVLLGDKDQLASVEAGAVLGDLCRRAEGGHYLPETAAWLRTATGQSLPDDVIDADGLNLDQVVMMLRVSHRFDASSGIGQLAKAVNAGTPDAARHILNQGFPDLIGLSLSADDATTGKRLEQLVVEGSVHQAGSAAKGYRHYLDVMVRTRPAHQAAGTPATDSDAHVGDSNQVWDDWARRVLQAHGSFQLLCALRRGPWGVEGLNARIRQALSRSGWLPGWTAEVSEETWYPGRPVLITRNDYGLGLMNGDIGITLALPDPEHARGTTLRVAFPATDGSDRIRWVLPARLRDVETVFAMTVHKSQGSEFEHTALVLPNAPNPILTRELVYTGITRARHWLTLVENGHGILDQAITRRVIRASGLNWDHDLVI